MSTLDRAAAETTGLLAGWGLAATIDPTAVVVPGALIAPDTLTASLGGALAVTWDVYLIAPDTPGALGVLGDMLDLVLAHTNPGTIDAASLALVNTAPDPLPALHLTLETETTP